MGYDVTTLGNHEYNYRSAGLADMLTVAKHSGERLPAIVQANYKPKVADTKVVQAWDDYPITDYTVSDWNRHLAYGVCNTNYPLYYDKNGKKKARKEH